MRSAWIVGMLALVVGLAACTGASNAELETDELDESAYYHIVPSAELLAAYASRPIRSTSGEAITEPAKFDALLAAMISEAIDAAISQGYTDVLLDLGDVVITHSVSSTVELFNPEGK